jgi:hypothetical protein
MAACEGYECPVFSVLDAHDTDRLLEKLHAVHGERYNLAPELSKRLDKSRARERLPVAFGSP